MRLKEAIQETGLTQKAIRYYEEQGLIKPIKQENGNKDYSEQIITQLRFIKALRSLHFNLTEVHILLEQEKEKQQVLLDKIKACDEQILELDAIKKKLKEMLEEDGSPCEPVEIKQAVDKPYDILITDPYDFFKKFHFVIMVLSILFVLLCFTTDTTMLLSKWTDRFLLLYLVVCAFFENKQKKKLEELAKDGYEDIQIQPQDLLLEMCYAFLWNCSILWMMKVELARAFALPTILCREGAGYVLLSTEISLLLIVKLYFSLKKWKRL